MLGSFWTGLAAGPRLAVVRVGIGVGLISASPIISASTTTIIPTTPTSTSTPTIVPDGVDFRNWILKAWLSGIQ